MNIRMKTAILFSLVPQAEPDGGGRSCQAEVRYSRLSLPPIVRVGQWRRAWRRGRGSGRCRGLRGQGLWERRQRKTLVDRERKSSCGRQPLGAPLDGRTALQGWTGGLGERWGRCGSSHTTIFLFLFMIVALFVE